MKIYDGHVHLMKKEFDTGAYLEALARAGVYGSSIFSLSPDDCPDFDERVSHVLSFVGEHKDRIFPMLWIHPDEDGIIDNVTSAVSRGILGFKMICNNYYVYEDKCMRLLERIASLGVPVTFHSGILWDGTVSSSYNRPINWEACIEIPKLRFALAHCSWPWYDECIALYGKFLNTRTSRPEMSAEMFFDITPGTPEIYREDLITKLHTIGYDVKHNIFFGTDCVADSYSHVWSSKWQTIDNDLYTKLNIPTPVTENIYQNNLLRFLGITKSVPKRLVRGIDGTMTEI